MFMPLLLALVVITTVTAQVQFDNSTCGISKGCVSSPPGCDPVNNCVKAFSWKVVGDYLNMELAGASSGGTINYIAVGFSSDDQMADEPVTDCTFGPQGTAIHLSYNTEGANARVNDYTAMGNDVQLLNSSNNKGRLYCSIRQRIAPSQSSSQVLSLNRTVYILLVIGVASDTGLYPHGTVRNTPNYPFVASGAINLSDMTAYTALSPSG